MRLKSNHEIVGELQEVKQENNFCILKFSCMKEIELPTHAITYEQLTTLIGKRIGILNHEGNYKFREIKRKKSL